MIVHGPAWPSTQALREALSLVESEKELHWGSGGKNGLEQLTCFASTGLACPVFTSDLNEAKGWVRGGDKVFGRRLHHTQGSDIIGAGYRPARQGIPGKREEVLKWITTRKGNRVQRLRTVITRGIVGRPERFNSEWLRRDFWVKVIPSVAEYRQHVWNGKCIRVGKKVQSGEQWRVQPVRSRSNGWHIDYGFQSTSEEFTTRIRDAAKKAVASLGYIGGAVDILEGSDGKLYVLEVNSAPSLRDERTLAAYVKAIKKWANPPATRRRARM